MKMTKDPHLNELHKYFNSIEHKVHAHFCKGSLEIKKVRKYNHKEINHEYYEVDVIFKGVIYGVHIDTETGIVRKEWFTPEIFKDPVTSKSKVNTLIKQASHPVVADVMAIFLGTVDDLCVKKVIWQE
jgi:hypothetical protein